MNFKKMAAAMTAGMLCAGSLCAVPVNAADKVTFDTWQEAYYEVLTAFSSGSGFYSKEQYGIGCSMYQIMDLDSNGIPELMISDGVYDVSTVRIYSFSGNMLTKPVFLGSYGVVYTDEEKGCKNKLEYYCTEDKKQKCSKCGAEIHEEAVICPKCGCAIEKEKKETTKKKVNAFDILGGFALGFGIVGIVDSIPGFIPLIGLPFNIINSFLAIFAIVFGAIGIKKAAGIGKCKGALVTGIITLVLNIIGFIIVIIASIAAAVPNTSQLFII